MHFYLSAFYCIHIMMHAGRVVAPFEVLPVQFEFISFLYLSVLEH